MIMPSATFRPYLAHSGGRASTQTAATFV